MNTNNLQHDLLTVPQVAERLQLSKVKVYGMVRSGVMPSATFGKSIRIPRPALDRWVAGLGDQHQRQGLGQ